MNTSYIDFLATHPPIFSRAKDPLDADDWLCTTESKFGLLHCTEYQKTVCRTTTERSKGAWWVSFTTGLPADHNVAWDEFHVTFHGHHLSAALCAASLSCMTTLRSLTIWHSTVGTMLTVMLRRLSSIIKRSISSCRIT
jgi:hypothetical protein